MTPCAILCLLTVTADLTPVREVLLRHRGKPQLTASEYGGVRDAVVRWVQAGIREGVAIGQMRTQLQAAGLLSKPTGTNGDWVSEIHSGYIGDLTGDVQPNSRVISIQIGTGQYCNFDTTAMVYPLGSSQKPASIVNADDIYLRGSRLVDLKAWRDPASRQWTTASAWFHTSCTSTLVQACFRIDRADKNLARAILAARIVSDQGKDVSIRIHTEGKQIEFNYSDTTMDDWVSIFPAQAAYRIEGDRVREQLIARTLGGFIGRAVFNEDRTWTGFEWKSIAHCGANSWEVEIQKDSLRRFIRVDGRLQRRASTLRIIPGSASATTYSADCRALTSVNALQKELLTELRP